MVQAGHHHILGQRHTRALVGQAVKVVPVDMSSPEDVDFNTLWEALAILVAIRLWRLSSHNAAVIEVRSDSLGALRSLNKMASPDPNLNTIAREMALDASEFLCEPSFFVHTPGIANVIPDKLSRMWMPKNPEALPSILNNVKKATVPIRDSAFWKSSTRPK